MTKKYIDYIYRWYKQDTRPHVYKEHMQEYRHTMTKTSQAPEANYKKVITKHNNWESKLLQKIIKPEHNTGERSSGRISRKPDLSCIAMVVRPDTENEHRHHNEEDAVYMNTQYKKKSKKKK